jgi:hypothetical protein
MNKKFTLLFLGFAAISILVFTGCRKKKDTLAIISVRNASNQPVSGAQVILYGQSTTGQQALVDLYDTTTTNISGDATFNFNDVYQLGQAGVAVLNIKAVKNGSVGTGMIKVEQETTTKETVYLP